MSYNTPLSLTGYLRDLSKLKILHKMSQIRILYWVYTSLIKHSLVFWHANIVYPYLTFNFLLWKGIWEVGGGSIGKLSSKSTFSSHSQETVRCKRTVYKLFLKNSSWNWIRSNNNSYSHCTSSNNHYTCNGLEIVPGVFGPGC